MFVCIGVRAILCGSHSAAGGRYISCGCHTSHRLRLVETIYEIVRVCLIIVVTLLPPTYNHLCCRSGFLLVVTPTLFNRPWKYYTWSSYNNYYHNWHWHRTIMHLILTKNSLDTRTPVCSSIEHWLRSRLEFQIDVAGFVIVSSSRLLLPMFRLCTPALTLANWLISQWLRWSMLLHVCV